jgi:hypothetical protein
VEERPSGDSDRTLQRFFKWTLIHLTTDSMDASLSTASGRCLFPHSYEVTTTWHLSSPFLESLNSRGLLGTTTRKVEAEELLQVSPMGRNKNRPHLSCCPSLSSRSNELLGPTGSKPALMFHQGHQTGTSKRPRYMRPSFRVIPTWRQTFDIIGREVQPIRL